MSTLIKLILLKYPFQKCSRTSKFLTNKIPVDLNLQTFEFFQLNQLHPKISRVLSTHCDPLKTQIQFLNTFIMIVKNMKEY